ncbi:MAG: polysaccharide biosynthesis tyrosine autokinase [Bacteroidales bacterium]|nr:polysaccharide biosynthesis tyrosine autokinase [Bacteroidales bacterium]
MEEQIKETQDSGIDIKSLIFICLSKWYWFATSVFLAFVVGVFVYLSTTPQYERGMQVLIKSDSQGAGGVMGNINEFGTFGNFGGNVTTANEIQAFLSNDLIAQVVNRMHLDVEYEEHGIFHNNVLYGERLPIHVQFLDLKLEDVAHMQATVDSTGTFTLSSFDLNDESVKGSVKAQVKDTVVVKTPIGRVKVYQTSPYYEPKLTINVTKYPQLNAIKSYKKRLTATKVDKQADVIRLAIVDKSKQRADDILDSLITVYNEQWVKDKNQIAVSTSDFINERLKVIEGELSGVDENIAGYKSSNMVPDVKAAANLYMNEGSQLNAQIMDVNNQLYMAQYIRNYLVDKSNITSPIPSISGITNSSIDRQISEYNEQILRRNNLVAQSSERNSLVVSADRSLETLRQSIISSMDNNITALKSQLQNLERNEARINSRISANPTQARKLLSVERQQSVKEALYLYLLQKREENELSQAFTAYNTRIIERPTGSQTPKSPRRNMILLVAIVIGFAIPAAILFIQESMNTKVRGRDDLSNLQLSFLGEIPERLSREDRKLVNKMKKHLEFFKRFRKPKSSNSNPTTSPVVVKEGKRDVLNEAFRVLRTNLEYMSNKGECTVFQQTSLNAGSGKSFISLNLGICIAIKKKRVLLIDGDLRRGTLSVCVNSPNRGLSEYLNGSVELSNIGDAIYKFSGCETLDVMPIGKMPPNPTELMGNGRFPDLIKELRKHYDYIFIDCPPVEIVADTQIVAQDVDRSIFVVRAGLMEKSALPVVQKYAESDKLKNTVVVLNGTKYQGGSYYGGRKGYYYGSYYHSYGYGNRYYNAE